MIVMKFGGTSVGKAEAIKRAISIIKGRIDKHPVVVVSALSTVTDTLYRLCDAAKAGEKQKVKELVEALRQKHLQLVDELVPEPADARADVQDICSSLWNVAEAVCTLGELTPRTMAKIISNGELLSSTVIWHAMNQDGLKAGFADARRMIIAKGDNMKAEPINEEIQRLVPVVIGEALDGNETVITQGFIASEPDGEPCVLGRGGSDYSASLIGMALDATAIEIWTDVDGVRTADPRRVANTLCIQKISFEEAAEMAHFGAKVLHPLTIEPAVSKNIPVYVLNSMNPTCSGTAILQSEHVDDGVKSVSFKENITMLNIHSTRMINVSGFLMKVFEVFAQENISVDLISTSEANITLTLDNSQNIDHCLQRLAGLAEVSRDDDKAQVSIIGKNVVEQRGLLRWAITSLNNVHLSMISQDASSVNISFVVNRGELDNVLQELHRVLFEY